MRWEEGRKERNGDRDEVECKKKEENRRRRGR